jgi:pSer/pThr/pTyr-binding forkhead associated (FHA) protein
MAGGAPVARQALLPNGRPIPSLVIASGPRTGERHLLFNGFLIGKQPGCHLLFEDQYTSSQHAQIGMDANGFCKLYDRGSTNGTYVNGVRVSESPLQHGHVIKIGATEMRFLAE